jgi:hypothetical protein
MEPTRKAYKINLEKLIKQCANLATLLKTKKWKRSYDEDCDCLYYIPKVIPNGVHPLTFKKDYSLYIDSKSNIQGFYIEYFKTNFLSHDVRFKSKKGLFISSLKNSKDEERKFINTVSNDILADIATTNSKIFGSKSCFV